MQSLILALSLAALTLPVREDDAKRTSKNGKLTGTIGDASVTVTYGRPQVKGRKIFPDVVPYNDVWRAGADEATVVAFEEAVLVEGKKLPAGVYGFFAIPGEKEWTIIFNQEPKQWGAYKYDKAKDALRVTVKPSVSQETTEVLTFKNAGTALELRFDKTVVSIAIKKA